MSAVYEDCFPISGLWGATGPIIDRVSGTSMLSKLLTFRN